ncbi:Lsr2 dimerization domain-containing protein [Serinicoccus sp. LYQ131]|uniref:Lsr2 dimerization domain-containing protein n=1 Tax=Serinicoccus sp. LYQ131 TaxID=3378797 RepID=UPI003853452F
MATKEVIIITSDLTGKDIPHDEAQRVTLAYNGEFRSLDLSAHEAASLGEALEPFMSRGRKITKDEATYRKPSTKGMGTNAEASKARKWLKANGHKVSEKGRIPADLMSVYRDSMALDNAA